jgi:L,D-transpeptidase ErfK/SrfK
MEMEGKPVITSLPPGPDNPLGRYKIKTSFPTIDIHETIQPSSIYRFMSHGCIRVLPEHMERFFEEVEINTTGELLYKPIKIARSPEGRIFLEVHRDVYGEVHDMKAEAQAIIDEAGGTTQVDWKKVDRLLHEKSGRAEDITVWSQGEVF